MPSPLIDAVELAAAFDSSSGPVLLDVRYRMGAAHGLAEFEAGHLPGAAFVDLDADLAAAPRDDRRGGRHPLPDPAVFAAAMRRCGVRHDRPVVVYDDWSGHAAARCWWLLRHHGHDEVRVLDGGWSAWLAAGGAVEIGAPDVVAGDFDASAGRLRTVDAGGLLDVGMIVDARAAERYRGETEPVDPVAGHVPGAVNLPTSGNVGDDGRFRSPDELRERYVVVGAGSGADVAVYCGSGVTACHDLLAMEVAGLTGAALYPGSWSDWVSDPARVARRSGRR